MVTEVADRVTAVSVRHPRLALFAMLAVVYGTTASYQGTSFDVVAAEEPARAVATHGTLDLSGVPHSDFPWYFEHDGGLYSDRFPAAILFLVPSFWVSAQFGISEHWDLVVGGLTAALLTAGSVVLLREVFKAVLPSVVHIRVATLFVAFGTGAWSIAANAPWSHTLDLFLISAALALFSKSRLAFGGLVLGLSVASRPTMAVGIAVLGAALGFATRSWRPTAVVALTAVPGVLGLIAYNGMLFDRWGFSNGHELGGAIELRVEDLPANIIGALGSPMKGLLIFYPILLVAIVTLSSAWRAALSWERAAALAGLAVLLTQLSLNRYSGGDAFWGPRLVIEPLALACPLLARSVSEFSTTYGNLAIRWMIVAGIVIHGIPAVLFAY